MIKNNEILDELNINDLKIIQGKDDFKYGTDAVMLVKFASISKNAKVLDLCTGSGIIPILLTAEKNAADITCVEYFDFIADRTRRSVEINSLEDKIKVICGDVKNIDGLVARESFDNVTVNPPYKKINSGAVNKSDYVTAARHEVLCDLDDIVSAADYSLKYGGKLTMVHRAERICDIISTMRKYKIEPKRIALIMHSTELPPKLILVEGKKGAAPGLNFEKPVFPKGVEK